MDGRIRIPNERIWYWCQVTGSTDCIDSWLRESVGFSNWTEHIGLTNLPYRSFSFKNERDATMFALKWL